MKARDFEYDGKLLSTFGLMICNFGSKGLETLSNGAEIKFNTTSVLAGTKQELISVEYEDCIEKPIQICKYSCSKDIEPISSEELRELTSWLGRKRFLKFKVLDEDHSDLYFEARFKISRIELDGILYGLELTVVTNTPFALKEPKTIIIKNLEENGTHSINDVSYEEGFIYPHTEITVNASGNLNILNAMEHRSTYIANCTAGEVITMDYPIIQSSLSSHKIQNDFNWNFFRIANTYKNSRNDLTISLPCTIKITYSPIVKVGL